MSFASLFVLCGLCVFFILCVVYVCACVCVCVCVLRGVAWCNMVWCGVYVCVGVDVSVLIVFHV
jgi:hypothetical protein